MTRLIFQVPWPPWLWWTRPTWSPPPDPSLRTELAMGHPWSLMASCVPVVSISGIAMTGCTHGFRLTLTAFNSLRNCVYSFFSQHWSCNNRPFTNIFDRLIWARFTRSAAFQWWTEKTTSSWRGSIKSRCVPNKSLEISLVDDQHFKVLPSRLTPSYT